MLAKVTPHLSASDAATAGAANLLRPALDSRSVSPNSFSSDGTPFLTLAVRSGDAPTIRLLLERGAKVDARDARGRTALFEAASLDQQEAARLLLAHHADPNLGNPKRKPSLYVPTTPLTAAIAAPSPPLVALLFKHGATVRVKNNGDTLAFAVQKGGSLPPRRLGRDYRRVLRGNALLDAQGSVLEMVIAHSNVRRDGGPALALAADRGQWSLAQCLMERGADVNAREPGGASVLMLTVKQMGMHRDDDSPEMMSIESLSAAERKKRPAEVAADNKEGVAFLRELLKHHPKMNEAYPEYPNEKETTALTLARYWKLSDVESLLKKAGAHR